MKLKWGADDIGETNGTRIAPEYRQVLDERFRGWAIDVVYTATTFIRVNGQADCKTKMDAIDAALEVGGKDLKFLNDDASDSANSVANADTLGGTRCVRWTWDPDPRGAQFLTARFLTAVFEYRVAFSGLTGRLLDFSETVVLDNRAARYAVNEAVNDVNAEILLTVNKPAKRATQTGFAVGALAYPVYATVAPNVFGGAGVFVVSDEPEYTTPKYRGSATEVYRLAWRKEYVSATALVASLNPWPAGG